MRITVLHFADYYAPYEGNFINSLVCLENQLTKNRGKVDYVFPMQVAYQPWWEKFSSTHTCHVTSGTNSINEIHDIIEKVNPMIIHTHFEGYDISVSKAINNCHNKAQIVWHMHDVITYHQNPLKRLYQYWRFFLHYFYYGKNVSAIGVSKQILDFTKKYRHMFGGNFLSSELIPNGIDFSRIRKHEKYQTRIPFTFLSYGGRNVQKRIDLLLSAAQDLVSKFEIRIIITKGTDTVAVCETFFGGDIPNWCQLIEQSDDINTILEQADCFVSTSVHETFSYAICEATYFGLPIIQSDIDGTRWNANNPSTFLFRSGDSHDLERAMVEVMKRDEGTLQNDISQTCTNNMKYGIDNWCERIISFYEKIIPLH